VWVNRGVKERDFQNSDLLMTIERLRNEAKTKTVDVFGLFMADIEKRLRDFQYYFYLRKHSDL
jgi:hypothetical protein